VSNKVNWGKEIIGEGIPTYIVAEIGINHNGDINVAKQLIDIAVSANCDAVKFQKRTPELCVPPEQRDIPRETPWGIMSYIDYRHKVEFGKQEYHEIDKYCKENNISWFSSCWDEESVDFMEQFEPIGYKIASACLTDDSLLTKLHSTKRTIIISTGMSTMDQIDHAVSLLDKDNLVICHCTSTYPCPAEELNLNTIKSLQNKFDCPIGYSGHETGLQTTIAAVVLGACFVERHITLDRAMWGSDQSASIEPQGLHRLVRDIRVIESAMGDGVKRVYDSERSVMKKLRRT
tara:strand:+ start:957 stop:1826 length:870 start_codon:yes stop_codon:yes gene_type:complete